jgi:hypothetical protein
VGKVVLPQNIAITYAAHESRLTTIRVNRAPMRATEVRSHPAGAQRIENVPPIEY